MKRIIALLLLLVLPLIGCSHTSDYICVIDPEDSLIYKQLIGKWISDKEQTLEWINTNRKISENGLNKFEEILGKLVIEYGNDKIISYYDSNVNEDEVSIINEDHNTLALWFYSQLTDEYEIRLIQIEGDDSYSVYNELLDIKEYFKKVE